MAKKRQKVFFITDSDGGLLGAVLASSRKVFEKKCGDLGFEIVKKEYCGDGDCSGCNCENSGLIRIPEEKFVPATNKEMSRFNLQEGVTLVKVNFGDFEFFVPSVMVVLAKGWVFIFHEQNPISL